MLFLKYVEQERVFRLKEGEEPNNRNDTDKTKYEMEFIYLCARKSRTN